MRLPPPLPALSACRLSSPVGSAGESAPVSPQVIREQYVGPPPPLQVKDFMSVEGLSGLYKRVRTGPCKMTRDPPRPAPHGALSAHRDPFLT